MQKLLNRLLQNSVERWHTDQGNGDYILVVILDLDPDPRIL